MSYSTQEVDQLVELAKAGADGDPIDWGDLNITEDAAYRMMASHVLEMDTNTLIQQSVIVKLLVENFVLNLRLMGKE